MIHALCRLLTLTFLFAAPLSSHARHPNVDIFGTWKVVGAAGSMDSAMSERQAHAFLGKTMRIDADRFAFNGRTCMRPAYTRGLEDKDSHFHHGWQTDSSRLPLPNPLTVINADCTTLYLTTRKEHIIVTGEGGVFFEAVRVKRKSKKSAVQTSS